MQNVLSGTISVVQCSSSIGTILKSSSSSDELSGELCDELSGSWSLSELSERNVRQWHTGLGGDGGVL